MEKPPRNHLCAATFRVYGNCIASDAKGYKEETLFSMQPAYTKLLFDPVFAFSALRDDPWRAFSCHVAVMAFHIAATAIARARETRTVCVRIHVLLRMPPCLLSRQAQYTSLRKDFPAVLEENLHHICMLFDSRMVQCSVA